MGSVKNVLFIDDGDIDGIVGSMERKLKSKGFELKVDRLDVSLPRFKCASVHGQKIDFDKLKVELEERYIDSSFDLVACDFKYGDDPLNGYQVTRWLKNHANSSKKKLRRAKFIIYSSQSDKFIGKFDSEELFKLIKLRIDLFSEREYVAEAAATLLLKDEETLDVYQFFREELEKYAHLPFNGVYPKFSGMKLGDVVEEIERATHHGKEFQKNIVELTVAHLIDLNGEER